MAFPSQFSDLYTAALANVRLLPADDLQKAKDAVNTVYTQTVVETEALETTSTSTLTPGSATYAMPTGISRLKTLVVTPVGGQTNKPLRRVTIDQILSYRSAQPGPATSNGTAWCYCILGLNDLELYPTPQSADVLTFYYTSRPTPLSADSDVPILPEPYATDCLVYGASAKLGEFSGDPLATYYRQLYDDGRSRFQSHLNRLTGRVAGQFNIQDAPTFLPHDPSVDIREWR